MADEDLTTTWKALAATWARWEHSEPPKYLSRRDFRTDLDCQRAKEDVPGCVISRYEGITADGEAWRAVLKWSDIDGFLVRVEIGGEDRPAWQNFEIKVDIADRNLALRRESSLYSRPYGTASDGNLSLNLDFATEALIDGEDRGGPWVADTRYGTPSVLNEIAAVLLRENRRLFTMDLLKGMRTNLAIRVAGLIGAEEKAVEAEARRADLVEELEGIKAELPDAERRRLARKEPEDLAVLREYPCDTTLGVVLLIPQPNEEEIVVKPTQRRSDLAGSAAVRSFRGTDIIVSRNGTVANAKYAGCSQEAGNRILVEAVRRFLASHPGAFARARLSDCSADLVDATSEWLRATSDRDKQRRKMGMELPLHRERMSLLAGEEGFDEVPFPEFPEVILATEERASSAENPGPNTPLW